MLHEQIKNNIKEAMLAKDSVKLETYRAMLAGFTNDLVQRGKKPSEMLGDDEALAVIARLVKQRKDSIEQYAKGGRDDLVKDFCLVNEVFSHQCANFSLPSKRMRELDK